MGSNNKGSSLLSRSLSRLRFSSSTAADPQQQQLPPSFVQGDIPGVIFNTVSSEKARQARQQVLDSLSLSYFSEQFDPLSHELSKLRHDFTAGELEEASEGCTTALEVSSSSLLPPVKHK